jgi:predicted transglutaminase-like cysteine proteinase
LRGSINDEVTGALPPAALGRLPGGIGDGLFGSVEVPVRSTVASDRWRSILAQDPGRYFDACAEGPICAAQLHKAFEAIAGRRGPELSLEMLRDVNAAVNRAIAFRSDDLVWGVEDYWASPAETAAKGAGDCEDFAIAKFGMLRALGVPASMMRIAVVKDLRKNIGHALLVVRTGDVSWILDNQAPEVRPDTAVTGYMPLYTLGVDSAWIHGVRRPGPTAAGDAARPVALKPSLN